MQTGISIRILILLSSSGISSVVERCLLACTQQRQGPNHQSLWGFLVFVFDGIKLFSKVILPGLSAQMTLLTLFLLFILIVVTDGMLESSRIVNIVNIQLNGMLLMTILEIFALSNLSVIQNQYVNIANNRLIEISILVELILGLAELIVFSSKGIFSSTSGFINSNSALLFIFLFVWILIDLEKVPFDLVEAESELIDGITTEFEGYIFSLIYAAEVVIGFISLKMFLTFSGFLIIPICVLILCTFLGRILTARLTILELLELGFGIGLTLTVIFLTVKMCS